MKLRDSNDAKDWGPVLWGPLLWGPVLWRFIHYIGAINHDNSKYLLSNITLMIPCQNCIDNSLSDIPIIENYEDLYEWSCDFHNKINIKLGKNVMTNNDIANMRTQYKNLDIEIDVNKIIYYIKHSQKRYPYEYVQFTSILNKTMKSVLGRDFLQISSRILGGGTVTSENFKNKYPSFVSLVDNNLIRFCGGTIIEKNLVLTAAHCVSTFAVDYQVYHRIEFDINKDINKLDNLKKIDSVYMHPKYSSITMEYDIAILKLSSDFSGNNNVLLADFTKMSAESTNPATFDITGWGTTSFEGVIPDTLRYNNIKENTDAQAIAAYNNTSNSTMITFNPDIMIAAGSAGNDTCQGDSGGPLYLSGDDAIPPYKLVGVVSWAYKCGLDGYPGVNTYISSGDNGIKEWINNYIKESNLETESKINFKLDSCLKIIYLLIILCIYIVVTSKLINKLIYSIPYSNYIL